MKLTGDWRPRPLQRPWKLRQVTVVWKGKQVVLGWVRKSLTIMQFYLPWLLSRRLRQNRPVTILSYFNHGSSHSVCYNVRDSRPYTSCLPLTLNHLLGQKSHIFICSCSTTFFTSFMWMDGQVDWRIHKWMDRWKNGWTDERTERQTNGRMDRLTDGWTD